MPGAVLLVDLHKAFDSLHWSFIFTMLKSYGFGNSLINWIRILYKNPKCRVVNNNFLSPPFRSQKGSEARRSPLSDHFSFMYRVFSHHAASEQAIQRH